MAPSPARLDPLHGLALYSGSAAALSRGPAGGPRLFVTPNLDHWRLLHRSHALRRAYRLLFADEGTLKERLDDVAASFADNPIVQEIVAYIRSVLPVVIQQRKIGGWRGTSAVYFSKMAEWRAERSSEHGAAGRTAEPRPTLTANRGGGRGSRRRL